MFAVVQNIGNIITTTTMPEKGYRRHLFQGQEGGAYMLVESWPCGWSEGIVKREYYVHQTLRTKDLDTALAEFDRWTND